MQSGNVIRRLVLDEPVIVLAGARSGSTLLRRILDAHPDLACPPETNIAKICAQLMLPWSAIDPASKEGELSRLAQSSIRAVATSLFTDYLLRRGKVRWCEKSIGTAQVAAKFLELYPKAKFICLYRHCMDVVDSGLEASPWGLMGYGFEQFAGWGGGNNVAALVAYWIDLNGRALEFEEKHPDKCHRVYYEELVADPEKVVADLFSFIGVPQAPGITERCLAGQDGVADIRGPGDHKIRAMSGITADSVGRGVRIPAGMIPAGQLHALNHLLDNLGYTIVDGAWKTSACPPALLSGEPGLSAGNGAAERARDGQAVPPVLDTIGQLLALRAKAGMRQARSSPHYRPARSKAFGLVAYCPNEPGAARSWRVDLERELLTPLDGGDTGRLDVDWLLTGDSGSWLAVLTGGANLASSVRSGQLRCIVSGDSDARTVGMRDPSARMDMDSRVTVARVFLQLGGGVEELSAAERI